MAPNSFLFDKARTLECVKMLAQMYIEATQTPPRVLIAVGGTAMVLRGIRRASEDIDLFSIDPPLIALAAQIEKETGIPIDITTQHTLWGELNIYDIEEDAQILENIPILGHTVKIAAISPETLFVVKSASMRIKDREDLPLLITHASPPAIIRRAFQLYKNQEDPYHAEEMFINVLSEIQLALCSPLKPEYFAELTEEQKELIAPILREYSKIFFEKSNKPNTKPKIF
jgi:hypothetical protein